MPALRVFLAFLVNAAVQISLVAAIAAVCAFATRRARAAVTHATWVLTLVASTLLPVLSLGVASGRGLPAQFGNGPSRWSKMDAFWQKIDSSLWFDGEGATGSGVGPGVSGIRLLAAVLVVSYLLFFVYRLGCLFFRWKSTRQMIETADPRGIPERVTVIAEECKRPLAAHTTPVLCSHPSGVPFTGGVFRPMVVLPESLLRTASDDELRAAIAHELVHIQRHDYLLNILYELISLPIAFHPCAFWMKRQIERTREAACDEIAARCLPSSTGYARALVSLARALPQPPLASVATSPALGVFDGNNLEKRVMQLLDQRPRLSARAADAAFAFTVVLLFVTCVASYNFALTPGDSGSQSSPAGRPNVSGVWTGNVSEKLPDGRIGHGALELHLEQNGDRVTGEANSEPIENVVLRGNHLKFSTYATGGPKGRILWTLDLEVKGDVIQGKAHAFRSADNHSWDVDVNLEKNK